MMKRALGVLAALSMVTGAVACSSSSDPAVTPPKDTGVVTDAKDTGSEVSVVPGDGDVDSEVPTDKTTGLACTTDEDCDKTLAGVAHCSNALYAVGPLNPTAVCVQFDGSGSDVCTPTDDMTIRFCDSGLGLCTKSGTNPATCDAMCIMNSDGTFAQKCAGKNACNTEAFGTDSMTMKVSLIGTCQGGCSVDADCPTGSKCDPVQRFCAKTCTADTDCKFTGAPAYYKCDTTHGACTFKYPKVLGDTCATSDDCLCFKNKTETNGYCIELCKTGDTCSTGFTCDALLPKKDDKGADLFSFSAQPTGLTGYCLKNCTADTDCPANQMCDTSAGVTQKTCRPKSTATDAGM